jgi:hypothetical protein
MDLKRTPERIRLRHGPNQRAHSGRYGRPPGTPTALPRPQQPKAAAVPGDDRRGFDHDERRAPPRPDLRQPDPEPAVWLREPHPPRPRPVQHLQLVPHGQHLELQHAARLRKSSEGPQKGEQHGDHRREAYPWSTRNINQGNRNGLFSRYADLDRTSACPDRRISPTLMNVSGSIGWWWRTRSAGWRGDG